MSILDIEQGNAASSGSLPSSTQDLIKTGFPLLHDHGRSTAPQIKKVLYANKFFYRKGGAEAVMFDEIELMRANDIETVDFSMQASDNRPSKYASYFVSPKAYRSGSPSDRIRSVMSFVHSREAVDNFTRLIASSAPDILHFHNIYHQLTPSIISAAASFEIPMVLTLHDYKAICPVYTRLSRGSPCTRCSNGSFESVLLQRCSDGSVAKSALLWAEARFHAALGSYRWIDRFIAPSRFMQKAVSQRLGANRVVYIPNGVDTHRIQATNEDRGYALYLGRLSAEKGVETLLKAHAADNGEWRLVVAGSGPLLSDLQGRFPLAEFTGYLAGERLETTLREASVIVVPSEWHENNPLSVLEAMANGKAIVASDIGGIPELVRDGENGLLFSPTDTGALSRCIKSLMRDPARRRTYGACGRKIAETEYSLSRHGEALLTLYRSLTGTPRSTRTPHS